MKSNNLRTKTGRLLLALLFVVGIGAASSTAVQAQWPGRDPYRRDRDRDNRRDRDYRRDRDDRYGNGGYGNGGYGGYGNVNKVAVNQGYQDGIYTGQRDGERGQSYNPQRSHFYQNGHGDNGGYGRYGNSYQYQQAYRNGFLRGYQQGFQQYSYNRRGNNGRYNRSRFPW
jgi:hypothetical protein